MKQITVILVLLISNLTTAQIEKEIDTLEIWTFSVGNFVGLNAEKIVSEKYPFKLKAVAGDPLTVEIQDSIMLHNEKNWEYLESIGYSQLEENLKSDLNDERTRIKKAVQISESNKTIFELFSNLKKVRLQNYTKLTKISDHKYEFIIYSYDLDNIDKEEVFELKFKVNLKNGKVKITRNI